MKVWTKYFLLQIPGWVLAGVLLGALHRHAILPLWAAVAVWILYVGKDFALYPYLRNAYHSDGKTGAEGLVGVVGIAKQALAPEGYVQVHGELWRARAEPQAERILPGTRIRVVAADGLTLIVTEDSEPPDRPAPSDVSS